MILLKLSKHDNINKLQIFNNMKFDLEYNRRSHKVTFMFKIHFFLNKLFVYNLIYSKRSKNDNILKNFLTFLRKTFVLVLTIDTIILLWKKNIPHSILLFQI